jgi:hemerythrin-like metal-binding protein/diguanylate cyclase (GGDEF)-like protein
MQNVITGLRIGCCCHSGITLIQLMNSPRKDQMPFVEWKPEFSVGIVRFDDDHRHLISLLNQLHSAIYDGLGRSVLSSILEGLIWYTQSHFRAEERLMERCTYPAFAAHKAEHDRFTDQVARFAKDFKSGLDVNAAEVASALEKWLATHILQCDAAYAPFFQDNAVADAVTSRESTPGLKSSVSSEPNTDERLKRSEQLGRNLSALLESIASNSALEPVLRKLVVLVKRHLGRSAAILLKTNDSLELVAGSGHVPEGIRAGLSDLSYTSPGSACISDVKSKTDSALLGCAAVVAIHGDGGNLLGYMILLDSSAAATPEEWDLLRRAARIASVAVLHRQAQDKIVFAEQHDRATELPNRLLLNERLAGALVQARQKQLSVAVLVIQLNKFQEIVDLYGGAVADRLLKLVAERLRASVPLPHTVARLSGGTFVVVWSGVPDRTAAETLARDILRTFKRSFSLSGQARRITIAIGVALYPSDASTAGDLIRNASAAMRQGRTPGRNTFQTFAPKTALLLEERLAVERHLESAIERGEMHLAYQPQLDLAGRIAGFEALLRWHNHALGNISPSVFIPIAEEVGLISSIDAWVLRQACLQSAIWQSAGAEIRVAINISASQFASADLVETVRTTLQQTCVNPSLIELEVTETAVMQNLNDAANQIERLRSLGVRIAIDDFGVGYSSLSYLRVLPADCVKIDRSFLENIGSSPNAVAILKAVIELTHQLGLEAILEGVETNAELELISPLAPDLMQGFLFYRPMSSARAEELFPQLRKVSLIEGHSASMFSTAQSSHASL